MRHFTGHTLPTAAQAGRIAAEASVKHLVLTHISAGVVDVEELVRDVRRVFDGEVTVGEDLPAIGPRRSFSRRRIDDSPQLPPDSTSRPRMPSVVRTWKLVSMKS
jgi:hypothetical protein